MPYSTCPLRGQRITGQEQDAHMRSPMHLAPMCLPLSMSPPSCHALRLLRFCTAHH